ncbi:hypothetical protein GF366_03480 [Candidatus Peregrinibacteria bacterium]|nr:hypothetical protein [Candidatus Peregrinibacteria bacterium]
MENIVEKRTCRKCNKEFPIYEEDQEFYESLKIPGPTHCSRCRQKRRLLWRNERNLYKRKCGGTGKNILSVYSSEKKFPVYDTEYWYSDKWDALEYGQDFDFNKPFFEQFQELMNKVPQLARSVVNNQNCDFVNQCGWSKNCYLIFEADFNENCMYSNNIYDSKYSIDMYLSFKCELCYECINCKNCYNLIFSQNCDNCSDSWFLKNCIGCGNCYGCVNLRNKQYYYLNEKYSKEEYKNKIKNLNIQTYKELKTARQNFQKYTKNFPQKYYNGTHNENSTGDYISNTQRCKNCFEVDHAQDCKYVFNSRHIKKTYDMTVFGSHNGAEYCCENHEIGDGVRNILFSDQVWIGCYDIYYSKLCVQNCHNLFGCIGLKHQNHCIFNKKYEKEEYEKLKNRIIEHMKKTGEWGEFFPKEIVPFAYNETTAQDYYPLTKEKALEQGYKWKDPDPKEYLPQKYEIPELIEDVPDTILNEILACEECRKNYKLQQEELKFYRRIKLPVPKKCFKCRHKYRFSLKNPRILYDRNCQKCGENIKTTYSPNMPELVYCEKCYLESIK